MVQAIRGGRKRQTRRVIKPQPKSIGTTPLISFNRGTPEWSFGLDDQDARGLKWWRSPYGQAGDVLWVKETHSFPADLDHLKPTDITDANKCAVWYHAEGPTPEGWGKTRVSLHMQRRFSRIALTITDVRVERLNDISEADAVAEGVQGSGNKDVWPPCAKAAYQELWQDINGPGSWSANPWVWVVEFEA